MGRRDWEATVQDGRVEGCALISSCKNTKITLASEQPSTEECWNIPEKGTQSPRAKEKLQQDGRRSVVMFKIKADTRRRCLEGTNKTLCAPGPREGRSVPHKRLSQTGM